MAPQGGRHPRYGRKLPHFGPSKKGGESMHRGAVDQPIYYRVNNSKRTPVRVSQGNRIDLTGLLYQVK